MPRVVCPNCQRIHNVMPNNTDIICNCGKGGGPQRATTQEDVLKLGAFEDFNGSGNGPTNLYLGVENKLQGTKSEIFGGDTHDRTQRGKIASLYRQRDRLTFIEVPKDAK